MTDGTNVVVLQTPGYLTGVASRLQWLEERLASSFPTDADLLILPELFQCGYYIGEPLLQYAEKKDGPFSQNIARLALAYGMAIIYGYAEKCGSSYFNSAQCIDKHGQSIAHHRKLMLPPGFETTLFEHGDNCQLFTIGDFSVAMLICYDVEFPENVRQAASCGAELLVVPTALGESWGIVSKAVVPARDLRYFGGSCIIGPDGSEYARAEQDVALLQASILKSNVAAAQDRLPYLSERTKLPWY